MLFRKFLIRFCALKSSVMFVILVEVSSGVRLRLNFESIIRKVMFMIIVVIMLRSIELRVLVCWWRCSFRVLVVEVSMRVVWLWLRCVVSLELMVWCMSWVMVRCSSYCSMVVLMSSLLFELFEIDSCVGVV